MNNSEIINPLTTQRIFYPFQDAAQENGFKSKQKSVFNRISKNMTVWDKLVLADAQKHQAEMLKLQI